MIDRILDQMTLDEAVCLLAGADFWTTNRVDRLGIPSIKMTDGPNGARGGGGLTNGVATACFPAGVSVGASWDTELARELGAALAQEAKDKGASILLGPTVNLHRSGLNGRNFECYSEDPHLTSELAVAYIEGVQSEGVAATIKHFVANDSEIDRQIMSSEVDERTLRELYLQPFEHAVKRAGVMAVMTGYNRVNGVYCSESERLLNDVLRREWGFAGVTISDWFGTHACAPTLNAGLDLEMPGPARHRGTVLLDAVKAGLVSEDTVRSSARRILQMLERLGVFQDNPSHDERAVDRAETRRLIRRMGAAGTVLMKNDGLLPMEPAKLRRIAVIGPNAADARIMGGGSAQLNAHYQISPLEALKAALPDTQIDYVKGCSNNRLLAVLTQPIQVEFFHGTSMDQPPLLTATADTSELFWFDMPDPMLNPHDFSARVTLGYRPSSTGVYLVGLASAGFSKLFIDDTLIINADEGWVRGENFFGTGNTELRAEIELDAGREYALRVEYRAPAPIDGIDIRALRIGLEMKPDDQDMQNAVEAARVADVALLFVGRNGEWDSEGLDLPDMRLPGRQEELIRRVACVNPRTVVVLQTGGPVEMPWLDLVGGVLQAWYPGQEAGHSIADVLLGLASPGGRLPQTFPDALEDVPAVAQGQASYPGLDNKMVYAEGLRVGYRHFDQSNKLPRFPFGYGLSYTTFKWGEPVLSAHDMSEDGIQVDVSVTNTGSFTGSEVVQLYVAPHSQNGRRPVKELRAFAKLHLEPGETRTCSLYVGFRDFAWFDPEIGKFRADAGEYRLVLASDAQTVQFQANVLLPSAWTEPVASALLF